MGSSTAPRISNLLPKCKLKQLKQIHAQITTTSLYQNIQILSKFLRRSTEFGNMEYPSLVFSQLGPHANAEIMLWNAMIRGFAFNGSFEKCITLYDEMLLRGLKPHNFTYPYVITSCSEMGWFRKGKQLHCRIVKTGFYSNWSVANALFIMCIKKLDSCNPDSVNKVNLNEAHNIFEDMYIKPIESWNRLITGYVSICDVESARRLFDDMPERDVVSWNSMITGYVKVGKVNHARDLFEQMPEKDVVSWTLMIGLYAYAGDIVTARRFFEQIPCRNVVSWNSMILSYNNLGQFGEALDLYVQMQRENVVPDEYTFVSVLFACAKLGALEFGKSIHYTIKDWSQMGVVLGTALIDMYAKCGDIGRAFTLFIKLGMKDEFCWNVMIRSLAIHGRTENAIKMYSFMQKVGLKPNDFTFTGVLFACSHGGLVEEGRRIFYSMKKEFGVNPKLEHYGCIIDLLSRNGQLEEALEVVKKMHYEPDIAIIGALLVGCRVRSNLKLAGEVMDMATKLQANEPGVHVMLSNMYASVGQWTEAQIVREKLEDDKITKVAGCSSVYHVASGCSEPQV